VVNLSFTQKVSSQPSHDPWLEFKVNALNNEKDLAEEVRKILAKTKDAKKILGKTSRTAYRRIHDVTIMTLDKIANATSCDPSFYVELSKALVFTRYQQVRDQISKNVGDFVERLLGSVINEVKQSCEEKKENVENMKRVAKNARALLDALAVFVYEHASK